MNPILIFCYKVECHLLYHLLVALWPVIFLYETKLISKEISRRLFVAEVTHMMLTAQTSYYLFRCCRGEALELPVAAFAVPRVVPKAMGLAQTTATVTTAFNQVKKSKCAILGTEGGRADKVTSFTKLVQKYNWVLILYYYYYTVLEGTEDQDSKQISKLLMFYFNNWDLVAQILYNDLMFCLYFYVYWRLLLAACVISGEVASRSIPLGDLIFG